uniref:Nucleoporin SEH1 n=1 Tax=Jaculus jaculus TaxID=51337 RepID=A0A8C5L6F0_JACJA
MFVARSIAADHKDLIHDVSFDFHGRRMATCSSDQSVKVLVSGVGIPWLVVGSVWAGPWLSCSQRLLVGLVGIFFFFPFLRRRAPDVMNLSQWSLQHEVSCKLSCSCISWNPSSSRAHSPMIAVGSDDSSPNAMAKVQIFEYNENTRKYAKAETLMTVTDPVHDIAFAPNLGRSFHILAIATKDVRIFTLKPVRKELTSSGGPTKFEIHIVAQFDNHNSQVWRVSWNITGTVLASSGDDGCVRLWKANYMDNWKCTGILKGNGSPVNGNSQQGNSTPSLGSTIPNLQNSLNGSSASR